ncbi:MAG: RNA-binding S4 domain-containing protein [Bryobacteraceae bacterium]|nr:RNA-binding S4 domain-containing protein [Bryobacteraceae bacterium]
MNVDTRVRIDKWLWAARFFKTRALATRACDLGRVSANGISAKPAREMRAGDKLQVKTEGGEFEIDVLALSDMRGPAATAQTLYQETEGSRERRRLAAEERKSMPHFEGQWDSRPSKRNRREMDKLRGRS